MQFHRDKYLIRFIDTFVPLYVLCCDNLPWQFEDLVEKHVSTVFGVCYLVRREDSWLSDSDLKDTREAAETFHNSQHTEGYVVI